MYRKWVSCALLFFSTLYIGGCGGGTGGSPNPTPPSEGTAVSIKFTGGGPLAVAQQTGTGTWSTASLQNGTLSLTVPQGTTNYAVAYLCPTWQGMGAVSSEYVIEATTKDATSYSLSCYVNPTVGTVTGNVNVSAIANATQFRVYGAQSFSSSVITSTSGSFSFQAPT
ncbi:MAG TPA: hypothetical protein VEI26_18075, partial [Terriglobales bacterium]|nr:hypothetical protein [Terriglobales bacterium]